MKKLFAVLFAGVLVLGLSAGPALASPINITIDTTGNLLNLPGGVATDAQYDAIAGNGNSTAKNLVFLSAMISRWNAVHNPDIPAAGALALDQGSLSGSSYAGQAGFQYVVFHWGNSANSPGGFYAAYYLGGEAISFSSLPQVWVWDDDERELETIGGFSSARYFGTTTTVPDGGMTLMLLGGALVGIGALRRKFSA